MILLQQCRPYDVKYIESDSHLSVYTMFVLGIINAMMNLKQFDPLVDLQWLYLVVGHMCYSNNDSNNNLSITF